MYTVCVGFMDVCMHVNGCMHVSICLNIIIVYLCMHGCMYDMFLCRYICMYVRVCIICMSIM